MEEKSMKLHSSLKRTGRVLLVYTGGTIGMGLNPKTGTLEPLDFNHLLGGLPEFEQIEAAVDIYQFATPIDSSDMDITLWSDLVHIVMDRYDLYDGFVILHGTDTMAYTASALSFMLQNLTKPVILTGSQLPIGQLRTDGKENLITSIELASIATEDGVSPIPEVCIYFSGHLLRGNRSTKQNADQFNAFESFNYPHLCDAGVNFRFAHHHILTPDFTQPVRPNFEMNPNVIVFSIFPGIQENIVEHLLNIPDLKGIVMRSYGSGNAPQRPWLTDILRKISERGITVVNISQCMAGRVEMGRYDTGYHLQQSGVLSGYDSTIEAAVTKLMHLTARHSAPDVVRSHMSRSLAGEITT
ncbi:MAG: type I asparaginase [Bacteroidales bacterium]|nr:type I asparaginase [Bacteroidales bacterium]MCM1147814.1 type I asparaginase [Bacteroidales bacterium]MCM1206462.1 type I asparaginase [Bacillota bacterium]MCM1510347.1 type I asparaginase [Clostridium sp.]